MDGLYLGGGACWSAWVCKGSKRFHLRVQPIWCMWENPQKLVSALLSSPASSPCLKARAILVSQRTWLEERNVFKLTEEIASSPNRSYMSQMFCSSHIFIFWFLEFWSFLLPDFLSVFFRLANLALQNVNKDYVIFLYFCNFIAKSDQKPKTKIGWTKHWKVF